MKNFNIFGIYGVLGGKVHKKPIYRGDCLKRGGGLGEIALRGGGCQEREGGVFEGGDSPMHTMNLRN